MGGSVLSIVRKKVTNHFNGVLLSSIIVVQWLILMHPLSSEEADYFGWYLLWE